MLGSQFSEDADDVSTAILSKSPWDDFEGTSKGLVWPLVDAFNSLGFLH